MHYLLLFYPLCFVNAVSRKTKSYRIYDNIKSGFILSSPNKANEFCGLTIFLLFFYICVSYCNNEMDLERILIGLQQFLIRTSVKLQNYY